MAHTGIIGAILTYSEGDLIIDSLAVRLGKAIDPRSWRQTQKSTCLSLSQARSNSIAQDHREQICSDLGVGMIVFLPEKSAA